MTRFTLRGCRRLGCALAVAVGCAGGVGLLAQQTLSNEPRREAGMGVTGAFEGWFQNADGSHSLLVGYMNRNQVQELDIPIGPSNRIEPGAPDQGQPTYFLAGRHWGMFIIQVPATFAASKLTWTLTVNGQTTSIPLSLHREYQIAPFRLEIAEGKDNTPPVLAFVEGGTTVQGPLAMVTERKATVGSPLPLTVFVSDDAVFPRPTVPRELGIPVTVGWSKFRGPGAVAFDAAAPKVEKVSAGGAAFRGRATTQARFSAPGEYVLNVTANDYSGYGGTGFGCCWTTGRVKVSVSR